jgi:hypothetical protein
MHKQITGYCTISNSEKTININYITASSLDSEKVSVKGLMDSKCVGCNSQSCPLYENAPKQI